MISVLTPTFNRAHTLPRLYRSLCDQTNRSFEWLVIDDGSTDDTASIVERWSSADQLEIRYYQQSNSGKHIAFNNGVSRARGDLVVQIDSDDELLPNALETLLVAWTSIPIERRSEFVGVTGLCVDEGGTILGDKFPTDELVSTSLETRYRFKIRGDKAGILRKDVLLRFPFPDVAGVDHVPEGIVWSRIARFYKTLYINQAISRVHTDPSGNQLTRQPYARAAKAILMEHSDVLNEQLDWFWSAPIAFLRSAVHYSKASLHLEIDVANQKRNLHGFARYLWFAGLPLATVLFWRDALRSVFERILRRQFGRQG